MTTSNPDASVPAASESVLRPIRRSLPMALLRAREAVMERFRAMLREHGLTEQQWRVLRVLAEQESLEISQLAGHSFLLPPSLSRILKFLDGKRLIRRRAVNADQRRFEVSLTAEGRRLFHRVAPSSEAIYREIEQAFGEDRLEDLYALLRDLGRALAPEGPDPKRLRDNVPATRINP
ncbi:MAG TPA: homoprotocatechuate degradation operon regulator HpaR [Woeseiaceae bacterium]|nr:homoprotocatechuate degradation operon regulator HpaR [Woeseiaceae bacterium]